MNLIISGGGEALDEPFQQPPPRLFQVDFFHLGSPPAGMVKLAEISSEVYQIHEHPERFKGSVYSETGHMYRDEMKERMVEWFGKYLW